jgi:hypothetical protein
VAKLDLAPLLHWIREREAIRIRKERGEPFPWTKDPILRDYRFCNVRREDDQVTRWIDEHIRKPYEKHSLLWLMLCIARTINWPSTLHELMDRPDTFPTWTGEFNPKAMTKVLERRRKRGEKIYTGAYMIRAESDRNVSWAKWSKQRYIAEIVIGRLWRHRAEAVLHQSTMQEMHSWLMQHRGWGPFMAYQAVVDMRFTPILSGAPDVETWAAAGPGTIRGLNRLHGRPVADRISQEQALEEILALRKVLKRRLPKIEMDLSDVPNSLCEMDKYQRVKLGEGRPRALYVPGRGD